MNRVIRFRRAHFKNGKFYKFSYWGPIKGGFEGPTSITGCDSYIDKQFTGLHDKNGKEIYEGDLVKCVNGHIGEVIWEQNDCCFNVSDYWAPFNDYPTMAFIEGQPFTITGNIHENDN